MERRAGADAVGHRGRRAHGDGAAHAVAHRPHLPVRVHGSLAVEEGDEGPRVGHVRLRAERRHQRPDPLLRILLAEMLARLGDRRPPLAVVLVHDQHRVAGLGETLPHLLEGRAQAQRVRPDQDARVAPARRMHEVAVARAVGRGDLDVRAGHVDRADSARQEERHARAHGQRAELPPRQVSGTLEMPVPVLNDSFVAHGPLRVKLQAGPGCRAIKLLVFGRVAQFRRRAEVAVGHRINACEQPRHTAA